MALSNSGRIFALLCACASARYDIKSNLQSGYASAAARLQELAQQALKDLAADADVNAVDEEAKAAKANIPAESDEWKAPKDPWIVDAPKIEHIDEIFFGFPGDNSTNLTNPPQRATLAWPKDSCPPSLGWSCLLTIPGRKNLRSTMQYVADLMASKGRMTLNIDMKDDARLKDVNSAVAHLKANNLTYNLNPNDIAVFGYSLGAITLATAMQKDYVAQSLSAIIVTSGASQGNLKAKLGLHWEEGKYYTEGLGYHTPPSLIIHCTDDGLVPFFAKKKQIPVEYVNYMKAAGLVSHGLFYDNGCYHHPFKNIGFFNQIDLFLKNPLSYEVEIYADPAKYKLMMDNFVTVSETHGCADNDEGIEPIRAYEVFNQEEVCIAACYQQSGCVAYDWYRAFAYERPTGKENCFLFAQPCENPKYDVCSDKQRCPKHAKMTQPRSVFAYGSLAQTAATPASIQLHRHSLRGSSGVGSQVRKVRTRSMCEVEPDANASVSNEGQKGLFVTLEAADSAGCVFSFTDFGGDCEDHNGVPTDITDALQCEDASARLEGYTFHGTVEESKEDEYPPGCFLTRNTGSVMFNPSTMPGVKSSEFAIACKVCDSMMAPQDTLLKHYDKITGDTTDPSYCAGEYDLGAFDTRSNAECAAKCDSIETCKHFALCTVPKEDCCQLSSTCSPPYKTASAEWSGFVKKPKLDVTTALAKFNKTNGKTCALAEYSLASFDIADAAACAAKCDALNECTSFVLCTDEENTPCCRLSSICAAPYTHSDVDGLWDAYMSLTALASATDAINEFIKTPGNVSQNSYCTGQYDLAEYHIYSPTECAAKCLARADCAHFKLCTGSEHMCCALSSTCTEPYTTASPGWDGYLNYALSRFRLAADMTPVVNEIEEAIVEPLCTGRTASIDLTGAAVSIDNSGGKLKMLWSGVAEVEGEPVDLVVQTGGDDSIPCHTEDSTAMIKNIIDAKKDGGNAIINMALGSQAELQFSFQDKSEKCVEFDEIHFTVLDVTSNNKDMQEIWEFSKMAGYVVKPNPEIAVEPIDDLLVLKSAGAGLCNDMTIDAKNLTEVSCTSSQGSVIKYDQDRRAAMIVYKRTCEFSVKIKLPGNAADLPSGWPFKFTFGSELEQMCS